MGNKPESRIILLLMSAVVLQVSSGQKHLLDFKDNAFVVGFPSQDPRHSTAGSNRLYITADEDALATIEIPFLTQTKQTRLRPGGTVTIELPGKTRMSSITGLEMKGIRITANASVSVYGLDVIDASADGFLALPLSLIGMDYRVPTFAPSMNAFVMAVATQDNTKVSFNIKLSGRGFILYQGTRYRNGDFLNVTLKYELDAFQVLADSSAGSLSGTRVISTKPVSVYSGNDCANVPVAYGTCDHLVEQIPPISTWGRTFLVKAIHQRAAGDFFQILASQDNTKVDIYTGDIVPSTYYLKAGGVHRHNVSSRGSQMVITDKPSLVTQYSKGNTVDGSDFSPFMSIIPSSDQFSNDFTLVLPSVPGSSQRFIGYATIFVSWANRKGVRIQGSGINLSSMWTRIPNSVFGFVTVKLDAMQVRIYHESPIKTISAIFYGRKSSAAFGYPAGFRISRPSRKCKATPMVPADRIDNDCDGRVDEEILNNKDDDGDGLIDEDLATPIPELIPRPIANDTYCSGKISTDEPYHKAHGLCAVRGSKHIVHRYISTKQYAQNCWEHRIREWTFTDGCKNVIKKTQNVNLFNPSRLDIAYPADRYEECPSSSLDIPQYFVKPKILSQCAGDVTMVYKDQDWKVVMEKCGYTSPVAVTRVWTIKDMCGQVYNADQTIYFKNKGRAPYIYKPAKAYSIGPEENITLACKNSGVPKPQITWSVPFAKGFTKINTSTPIIETEVLDDFTKRVRYKAVQADGSLLITDTRTVDSGLYQCHASNLLGNYSITVNLTVYDDLVDVDASVTLPDETFDDDLLNDESDRYNDLKAEFEKELTNIFQNMTGFQRVEILGFRNGSVKVLFRVVIKTKDKNEKPNVVVSKVGKHLNVQIKGGKIGSYKVIPTAALQEKPPPPQKLESSNIKHKEVHVSWSHPELYDMYAISGYLLQYKEFGDKWGTYATVLGDNHRMDGLKSGTSYSIRLKAKNKYGLSEPSSHLELTTKEDRSVAELVLIIVIPILVVIIAIVLVLYFIKRKRSARKGFQRADLHDGHVVRYSANPQKGFQILNEDVKWKQIPRESLELGRVLGEGEFGQVIEGIVTNEKDIRTRCAVKKLKRTATESDWKDLLNELDIMLQVGEHPNIVNLVGACSDVEGPLLVVVEYCANGNLLKYLQKNSNKNYDNLHEYVLMIPVRERMRIAADVANGMAHLERMRCVHRDLAARNVLLDEHMNAKVSDFGLSRDIYTSSCYEKTTGGKLPAKWMAIESIDAGLYTTHSDVWSFGVLLWEIETGGCIPYPTFTVMEMLNAIKQGYRLEKPYYCPEPLYKLMLQCWSSDPALRPPFGDLCLQLNHMHDVTPQSPAKPSDGYEDMSGSDRETYT